MKRQTLATLMGVGWAACGAGVLTQERPSDPPPSANREVTLTGNVLSNVHLGEKGRSVFLLAYDGTPEVRAEFARIMAEHVPEKTYPGIIRFRVVVEAAAK